MDAKRIAKKKTAADPMRYRCVCGYVAKSRAGDAKHRRFCGSVAAAAFGIPGTGYSR